MKCIDYLTPECALEVGVGGDNIYLNKVVRRLHINKKSIQYTKVGGIDSFGEYKIIEGVRNDTGNS